MSTVGAVRAPGDLASVPPQRLVQAAHEFEAQMMKELLKPMTSGSGLNGNEEDPESGGPMADFATEALGQALSRQGGLGIADTIIRSLSQNEKIAGFSSNAGTNQMVLQNVGASGSSEVHNCR
jgi:Rod binding domain-containing protein